MDKAKMIKKLYFKEGKNLTEIAEIINTSISYISKILRKDEKYKEEKEKRKQNNLQKRRKVQKNIIYNNRRSKIDTEYINMKNQHEIDVRELSKHSTIGNEALRKWASSAYVYNKNKKRYEFDTTNLTKPADYPMYIKI